MAAPHRAMFPLAGVWGVAAVIPVAWQRGLDLASSPLDGPVAWHAHEMVFGFAAAMFAGYALTAMASWPGAARPSSARVAALVFFWGLGRLSAAGAIGPDLRLAVPAGVAFIAFVALILVDGAMRSGAVRAIPLALFSLAMTVVQVAVLTGATPLRLPVFGFAALLSVVGGRMVAAFTRHRLADSDLVDRRFRIAETLGRPGLVAILFVFSCDTIGASPEWSVVGLLVAAVIEAVRSLLWLSRTVLRDGLLLMLYVGYFWLPMGLALLAYARIPGSQLPESAALHAVAAGAVACSIQAVAARAIARRADRLQTSPIDMAGFLLVWIAATLRVGAPAGTVWHEAAPIVWCLAWAVFVLRHGMALFRPAPRPVFSGPKRCSHR